MKSQREKGYFGERGLGLASVKVVAVDILETREWRFLAAFGMSFTDIYCVDYFNIKPFV